MSDVDSEGDVLVIAGGHFFRTHRHILQTNSGYFKSFQNDPSWSTVSPISLPTIPSASFADLLHFMYTGQLCVTGQNIYELLLCAQMLHMPSAIEVCRQFLLGTFALPKDPHTPPTAFRHQFVHTDYAPSNSCVIRPIPIKRLFIPEFTLANWRPEATTSQNLTQTQNQPREEDGSGGSATSRVPDTEEVGGGEKSGDPEGEGEVVVVDVACCDGPVTFERIVNENYKQVDGASRSFKAGNVAPEPGSAALPPATKMVEAREERERDSGSSGTDRTGSSSVWSVGKSVASAVRFSCIYCNHLFKSRYCYQKHKQRHINPIPTDKLPPVQPKDKNVTFYPCKSCGAKFPSYYFVHKHRRHCHSANKSATE